jgi:hypothetical protein
MWNQVNEALNQSAAMVGDGIARLLPGTIALLLALLVSALLGGLLAFGVRRALTAMRFDERMAALGWGDGAERTGARGPTYLISRLAGCLVVFLGFLVGISAFSPALTSELKFRLFGSAMNLVTAAIVLVVGALTARLVARTVLINLVNMNVQQARLIALGVRWLIVILAAAMALEHVQVGGRIVELAFGILFGGIVLALALAVGLRSKDLAEWSLSRKLPEPPPDAPRPLDHF